MPTSPPSPCCEQGCHAKTHGRYCDEHQAERDRQRVRRADERRPSAHRRGYDGRWQKVREQVLANEPLCRHCLKRGVVTAAACVDHITPIAAGGERYDTANLQALCWSCHSRKTVNEDGGLRRD